MKDNEYIWPIIETSRFRVITPSGRCKWLSSQNIITRIATTEVEALKKARKSYRILKSPFSDEKRTYTSHNSNTL